MLKVNMMSSLFILQQDFLKRIKNMKVPYYLLLILPSPIYVIQEIWDNLGPFIRQISICVFMMQFMPYFLD
jgi:hypothetical protein